MSNPETAPVMCSNCKYQPVAESVLCGFTDWCADCDRSLFAFQEHAVECDRNRRPHPPPDPLANNRDICPCGFFAIRNRPLARPVKSRSPVHMLVTVPITNTVHVVVCLICDAIFKHHRNALKHVRHHHQHYHFHHQHHASGDPV